MIDHLEVMHELIFTIPNVIQISSINSFRLIFRKTSNVLRISVTYRLALPKLAQYAT